MFFTGRSKKINKSRSQKEYKDYLVHLFRRGERHVHLIGCRCKGCGRTANLNGNGVSNGYHTCEECDYSTKLNGFDCKPFNKPTYGPSIATVKIARTEAAITNCVEGDDNENLQRMY